MLYATVRGAYFLWVKYLFALQWYTWRKARTAGISRTYWRSFTPVFRNMSRDEFGPVCDLPGVCWWTEACPSCSDVIQGLHQTLEVCIFDASLHVNKRDIALQLILNLPSVFCCCFLGDRKKPAPAKVLPCGPSLTSSNSTKVGRLSRNWK